MTPPPRPAHTEDEDIEREERFESMPVSRVADSGKTDAPTGSQSRGARRGRRIRGRGAPSPPSCAKGHGILESADQ